MIKMQIKMDEKKILLEKKYSLTKIQETLDRFFLENLRLAKGEDGFYLGSGIKTDFGNFGRAMWTLSKKPWFLDNVDIWLYFNSDDSDDPNDFVIEDFKDYCLRKYGAIA